MSNSELAKNCFYLNQLIEFQKKLIIIYINKLLNILLSSNKKKKKKKKKKTLNQLNKFKIKLN